MERIEVSRSARISAPAKLLWGTIGDFGSITSYFPSVVRCTLEGSGVGARRHLVTDIGGTTSSELIELDDTRMIMGYRVLSSTVSIENYTSHMSVRPLDDHHCEVTYTSCFEPRDPQKGEAIRSFIETQLDSALRGLRRLHENPQTST
jgi:hypothetical protein